MLIGLCYTKPGFNGDVVFDAFKQGLSLHGDSFVEIKYFNDLKKIEDCDAVIMISYPDLGYSRIRFCEEHEQKYPRETIGGHSVINAFRTEIYRKCVTFKKRMMCVDSGVIGFERKYNATENVYQIGWDKIKGLGKYYNQNSPSDRWDALGKKCRKFSDKGRYVLLFGQVRYGVGSQHVDIFHWYRDVINYIDSRDKETKIVVKLHPNSLDRPFSVKEFNLKFINNLSFDELVRDASLTLSYSSHSIVESVISGTPSWCCSQLSMGSPLFHISSLDEMFTKQIPSHDEVLQWLYDLCYTQWSVSEIKNGKTWEHLRPHTTRIEDVGFENMLCKL